MTTRQLPVRVMQPTETRTLPFAFAEKLAQGDSLVGTPTVTIAPAGLTSPVQAVTGSTVLVRLTGGANGSDYEVDVTIGTALGDTLTLSATVQVRAGAN